MAHHGSGEIPEDLLKVMKEEKLEEFSREMLGPTNKFPDGKLAGEDEGELKFAIGTKNGTVVIDFGSPVHWVGMDPKQAVELAQLLLDNARKITDEVLTLKV